MSKKLKPNYGQVILQPLESSEQTYGNIVIPDIADTKNMQAVIVDIAPIYNFNSNTFAPLLFEVGDLVLFPSMGAVKTKLDGKEYYICSVADIPAGIVEQE